MKSKFFLIAVSLLGFTAANAAIDPDPISTPCKINKDELLGLVLHSETKKPLKDVSITAYLVSKKEKSVQTDEAGNYSFDELKPGTYKFVFEKTGYKRVTKEKVVVKTDEGAQLNIEMVESKDFDMVPTPMHFLDF